MRDIISTLVWIDKAFGSRNLVTMCCGKRMYYPTIWRWSFRNYLWEIIDGENYFESVIAFGLHSLVLKEDEIEHSVSTGCVNGLDTVGEILGRDLYEEMRHITSCLVLIQKGGNSLYWHGYLKGLYTRTTAGRTMPHAVQAKKSDYGRNQQDGMCPKWALFL